jgi:predicted  nucleic acid-binding Zn-ribbon protein
MRSGTLFSILTCLIISGCGEQASNRHQADQTRIFDTQRDALDRTKSVQGTVDEAARRNQEEAQSQ